MTPAAPAGVIFVDGGTIEDVPPQGACKKMNDMTLKQAIGQLFMIGIPGATVDGASEALLKRWQIGNIVLFARNLKDGVQAARLTDDLQRLITAETGIRAYISADQEGGIVLRLVDGATPFPGNMAVGATGKPEFAEQIAYAIGRELLALGINMNLAPVLDVNNNPKNPVIGVRSFGTDPARVARFGRAAVRGYKRAGIACVAKHFPGHGDTEADSHTSLPTIPRDLGELEKCELLPFRAAIEEGLDAVMTAHIAFPKLDGVPATLSKTILTGILRRQLGFSGLILTDSMRMAGVADSYSPAEAAVMALKAGCDILLYSGMGEVEEAAVRAVHEAVARGELSEERIYASAERIVAAKKRLVRERPSVDLAAHADLARQVSRKAVTLRRDRAGLIPLPVGNVTVIEVTRRAITQVEEQLQETGLRAQLADFLPAAQHLAAPANPDALTVEQVLRAARGDVAVVVTQDAWRHGGQQDLLRRLVARYPQRIIHVAGRLPYDVDLVPEVPTALCIYDTVTPSIRALLEVLTGRIEPTGNLP